MRAQKKPSKYPGRHDARSALTLAELVVALAVSGLAAGGALLLVGTAQRALVPVRCLWKGEKVAVAPSFSALPEALEAQALLEQEALRARAIYVFGGLHPSLAEEAVAARQRPLAIQGLPDPATVFSTGLPLDAHRFYALYRSILGPEEDGAHGEDFTVLMLGGSDAGLTPSLLAQVRRHVANSTENPDSNAAHLIREVLIWTATGERRRYVFAEREDRAGAVFTGAIHSWYRYHEASSQFEEGPASVAFPDPWALSVRSDRPNAPRPQSRFCHLWPVSR